MGASNISSILHESLPRLSLCGRAIIDAALLNGGSIGTAQDVAHHLGLRNRFALARLMTREGLPPLKDLAAWASVLTWVDRTERTGCSLCEQAFRVRKDPGFCYRTVNRITGRRWQEHGLTWTLKLFLTHCRHESIAQFRASRGRA